MNLAIVGCGMVANEHLRALRKVPGIKIVALCDRDKKTVARMSQKWNVETSYTDYRKMLDEQELSMISVLTPPESHVPIAIEAVNRGVNVVIEKPLTMRTAEAEPLLEALRGRPVKVTVNHTLLYCRVMFEASRLVRSGAIGDVLGAEMKFLGTPDDSMASDKNHWSHKLPGGRFGEMIPHPVYAVQSVIQDELGVEKIVAEKRGKYPWMAHDEMKVLLRGREKGWADIYVSFNAARPVITMDVYGTRKILKIDILNQSLIELGERSLSKVDSGRDLLAQSSALFLSTIRNTVGYLGAKKMEFSLRNLYTSFMESIASGRDPPVTPRMAFETVRVSEEICNRI